MRIIASYNIKGGVGKTASVVNLAYLCAQEGYKTLVWDMDPQGAASFYYRIKPKVKGGGRRLLIKKHALEDAIKGTDFENLDLLPADFSHRSLDIVYNQFKRPERRLDKVIRPLQDEYDLVIFDCPPSINILAENIFTAADLILVPLIPTTLSERTHTQLLTFFQQKEYNLDKLYAFISMVDRRKKLHRDLSDSFRTKFDRVLQNTIPYSSDVERMGVERKPVNSFAPRSTAATSYRQLWAEIRQNLLP
jgi:cellulose biosynthesis protein BcsQ